MLVIKKSAELLGSLMSPEFSTCEIHSAKYHLIPVDLRCLQELENAFRKTNLQTNQPTLFLSECVLIYMTPQESQQALRWLRDTFEHGPAIFVLYEQIKPDDPFGKVMVANLEKRGCPLLSLKEYPDLDSQKRRFSESGWTEVGAIDMNTAFNRLLELSELERIKRLEMFDEIEEWVLIQAHYCLLVALSKSSKNFTIEGLLCLR